jgi:hypothetical protein
VICSLRFFHFTVTCVVVWKPDTSGNAGSLLQKNQNRNQFGGGLTVSGREKE